MFIKIFFKMKKCYFFIISLLMLFILGQKGAYAECPIEDAVDFYSGVTAAGIQVMSGRIPQDKVDLYMGEAMNLAYALLPQSCKDQFQSARNRIDVDCQNLLAQSNARIENQMNVVKESYARDGNADILFARTREAMATFVSSVPHRCWFGNIGSGNGGNGGNCQTLESNYRSCKKQVENALKKCAVSPHPCRDRGPYCVLPSSINPSCTP